MKCPSCGTENTDPFCTGCGADLTQIQQEPAGAVASGSGPVPGTAIATATLPVVTLSFGGRDFPLARGEKILIARKGSDKCTPGIEIESDKVSSTPIEVSVDDNDQITIRDTGTSQGIRVVKFLQPGESIEAKPGEMIMAGNEIITLT